MPIDRDIIGKSTGRTRVVIERGPVAVFADAVKDRSPEYRNPAAAGEAGHTAIPAPPTFPIAMAHWGAFEEIQPESSDEAASLLGSILGPLLAAGGLILHGEQEFEYSRTLVVGDSLIGEGRISDAYEKVSGDHSMTFIVSETVWSDEANGEPVVTARSNLIVRK